MCRLSVMLMCFNRGLGDRVLGPRDLIDALSAAGISGLEPAPSWCEQHTDLWVELRQIAQDQGMDWSCCDVSVNFIGDGSEQARREAMDAVSRGVDFCRELGCERALLPGTKPAEGMSESEGRRLYGERLAEAVERHAGSGVTLMIEDFGVYPLFTAGAAHCREVLDIAGPGAGFTFDNGNFLLGGDAPAESYPRFRDRIEHVHIKDFRVRTPDNTPSLTSPRGIPYEGCEIGTGDAQVRGCVRLLKADRYTGWLSIEAGGYRDAEAAVQGAKAIQEAWRS